nr:tata element modulatory factor [Quercus suber]
MIPMSPSLSLGFTAHVPPFGSFVDQMSCQHLPWCYERGLTLQRADAFGVDRLNQTPSPCLKTALLPSPPPSHPPLIPPLPPLAPQERRLARLLDPAQELRDLALARDAVAVAALQPALLEPAPNLRGVERGGAEPRVQRPRRERRQRPLRLAQLRAVLLLQRAQRQQPRLRLRAQLRQLRLAGGQRVREPEVRGELRFQLRGGGGQRRVRAGRVREQRRLQGFVAEQRGQVARAGLAHVRGQPAGLDGGDAGGPRGRRLVGVEFLRRRPGRGGWWRRERRAGRWRGGGGWWWWFWRRGGRGGRVIVGRIVEEGDVGGIGGFVSWVDLMQSAFHGGLVPRLLATTLQHAAGTSSTAGLAQLPKKSGGGWGSLLSGAVANLESRLDTILADDADASARERAAEKAARDAKEAAKTANPGTLAAPSAATTSGARDASRTRTTDRLAERLAKATAQKSNISSQAPSRVATPVNDATSGRTSAESLRSADDLARSTQEITNAAGAGEASPAVPLDDKSNGEEPGTLLTSGLPINPARVSVDSIARPSVEVVSESMSSPRPSIEVSNGTTMVPKSTSELEAEIAQMREDYEHAEKQRQEEMHIYMEKIDALQAKLSYLAKETLAAAKEANAAASAGGEEGRLAAKDEQIALLMQEGEKLSKTELKHLQTIKKLRTKTSEDERTGKETQRKLEISQRAESELKQKLKKTEAAERLANEKVRQIAGIEEQVEELRVDRENAAELVRSLTTQLKEARDKVDRAEREAIARAAENDKGKIAVLQNELEDAQIEKKLAIDRATAEVIKVRDEADRQKERFGVTELELKSEIAGLESKLETVRSRAEAASSDGTTGEGSTVKLMRQVETLQNQYALAKENWETIEGSLNSRVSVLEKDRDETAKREAEIRKKARELGVKSRKLEEELESTTEQARSNAAERQNLVAESGSLRQKLDQASVALSDAKTDLERQQKGWEAETSQRIEEEKLRWQRGLPSPSLRNGSTMNTSRKVSAVDLSAIMPSRRPMTRLTSHDLSALHTHPDRTSSRRGSGMPTPGSVPPTRPPLDRSSDISPSLSRQESITSFDPPSVPPTPSIEVDPDFEHPSESPHQTINDLVSTSTAGAGPSVQLVERLSLAVRRLESEKATFRDELTRLSGQRDEARNEVVALMRAAERKRPGEAQAGALSQELQELRRRYDASLEMLGEREEQVQDLRGDVTEMKRIYRELVETKVGPAKAAA